MLIEEADDDVIAHCTHTQQESSSVRMTNNSVAAEHTQTHTTEPSSPTHSLGLQISILDSVLPFSSSPRNSPENHWSSQFRARKRRQTRGASAGHTLLITGAFRCQLLHCHFQPRELSRWRKGRRRRRRRSGWKSFETNLQHSEKQKDSATAAATAASAALLIIIGLTTNGRR